MSIATTATATIAGIVAADPAAIKVFQRHQIDFCCGGHVPLAEVCARQGLDPDVLLAELHASTPADDDLADWRSAPLHELVTHIQQTYHTPLREELPRLGGMLAKVVSRHGQRLPDRLFPLERTFERLRRELLEHMMKEDAVLFPAIVALDTRGGAADATTAGWIEQPIGVMEAEHAAAGEWLAMIRELTDQYAPPEDACATFRGLYHGLSELERVMHLHVHLENNILFPRAAELAHQQAARGQSCDIGLRGRA